MGRYDGFITMFVFAISHPSANFSFSPVQETSLEGGFMANEFFWKILLLGK